MGQKLIFDSRWSYVVCALVRLRRRGCVVVGRGEPLSFCAWLSDAGVGAWCGNTRRACILLRCRPIISYLCRVARRRGRVGHFALPPRVNPPDWKDLALLVRPRSGAGRQRGPFQFPMQRLPPCLPRERAAVLTPWCFRRHWSSVVCPWP